jgi:carboxyl-terminal processing protease
MRRLLTIAFAITVASCGGSGGGGECSIGAQKQFVLDVAKDWYLFPDLLTTDIDPGNYATTQDYLDALVAKARDQNKDRHFSFVTSAKSFSSNVNDGQAILFGFTTRLINNRLFIALVESNSPAMEQGFHRGDEILAVGPTPDNMTPVSVLIAAPDGGAGAFGPSEVGVSRSISVHPVGAPDNQTVTRTVTKRVVTLDTVSASLILPRQGQSPVGYVAFETFIEPSANALRIAFQQLKNQGVNDVIVDLRYNGGGEVPIAELLADLLGSNLDGHPMFSLEHSSRHSGSDIFRPFTTQAESLPQGRIAFIATSSSASASELVINSLDPYRNVAIIGGRTFGKPVGQHTFQMEGCDTLLGLISFATFNSAHDSGYFDGLPDAALNGPLCSAEDDLNVARGSTAEASTAAALSWINNNACPAAPAKSARPVSSYLIPASPSQAQRERPGLF